MAKTSTPKRISKVAKELNVGTSTIFDFLEEKGIEIPRSPNSKISEEVYEVLLEKYQPDKLAKEKSEKVVLPTSRKDKAEDEKQRDEVLIKSNVISDKPVKTPPKEEKEEKPEKKEPAKEEPAEEKKSGFKVVGKIDLDKGKGKKEEKPAEKKEEPVKEEPVKEEVKEEKQEEVKPEEKEVKAEEKQETEKAPEKAPEEEIKTETEVVKEEETVAKDTPAKEEEKKEASEPEKAEEKKPEEKEVKEEPKEKKKVDEKNLKGLTVVGKIDLSSVESDKSKKKPVASTSDLSSMKKKRRKRKRIKDDKPATTDTAKRGPVERKRKRPEKEELDEKQIQDKIKQTLSKISGKQGGSSNRSKMRKKKREESRQREEEKTLHEQEQSKIIKVTEFITVNELANVMDVTVTEVITACLNLGLMVSINQRIDAETITVVADEFGFDVEFTEANLDEPTLEEEDSEERMGERAPIVTIMGHVDHGKTSLLDYIRKSNIIAGEAGGITQHIGAYEVTLDDGRKITVLDTPGHEAFTAMRARGAKVTDVAIIVIAADDNVMPQTKEAISHAQAAGVPIVFAYNKMDKEGANADKIRQELADMNILVEEWGGKYQTQEISAKKGMNIDDLLEKVLLEAEILELKADPKKRAVGTVLEASLDRGKGIVSNILVQAGTLGVGDPILAGAHYGRVKAMFDERGNKIKEAGPSRPVQILGFDGAPQAGDKFYVTEGESIAKEMATERKQLIREQGIRATKHITLDEIGRRLAIGNFQELNLIIKGDVDGSVEAISDSMQKLSTDEIQVKVIHKGVGQITESDVLLASASDAIILGFQVRPSLNARKLAEKEQIDIRLYSVIYDAIDEVKSAMEGMLSPKIEEKIIGNVEIREIFKITKVGTIAGCYVLDGKIKRESKVRIIRDGVVIYSGELDSLKRFKDDVKEVQSGYECGLNIKNFNDIKVGDIVEAYEEVEVKRKL